MSNGVELEELLGLVDECLDGGDPESALLALQAENIKLIERFRCDPSLAVTGELFRIADVLCEQGELLALHFASAGSSRLEERAWELRSEPIQTAYPHKRNRIGPVLLDWANCNRRIDEIEKADSLYEKIIDDFQEILPWGPTFNDDWILSVRCLLEAVNKSSSERLDLSQNISELLERSEDMREKEKVRKEKELAAHHRLPAL